MEIKIICDATEYSIMPTLVQNSDNLFIINDKSLIISFLDEYKNIIQETEISIEDAKKLAKMILNY